MTQLELMGGRSPTEQRSAAVGEESRGDGGSMPDQGRAGGTREPDEITPLKSSKTVLSFEIRNKT